MTCLDSLFESFYLLLQQCLFTPPSPSLLYDGDCEQTPHCASVNDSGSWAQWEMWQRLDQTNSYFVFRLPLRLKEKNNRDHDNGVSKKQKRCTYVINYIVLLKPRDNSSHKSEILLLFTHTHTVPNLYEHTRRYWRSQWGPNNLRTKEAFCGWQNFRFWMNYLFKYLHFPSLPCCMLNVT